MKAARYQGWSITLVVALLAAIFPPLSGHAAEKRSANVKTAQSAASKTPETAGVLSIISSSHQDIAWMDSPEKCVEYRDKNVITPALALLAKDPGYAFTMENMLNLMEYLGRHPERRDEVVRDTREGRMEWGATFNQPYESLFSGEQLIREVYFGRRWIKKNFPGCDARVYFSPDVPGRSMQMPQILAKAGIPYMVMSRYHEGFYRWASPDGTSVLAYSPGHYGNAAAYLNAAPAEGVKAIADKIARWKDYYAARGLPSQFPLLNSVDFSQPTDFSDLIKSWNGAQTAFPVPLTMRYSSARRFFEGLDVKAGKFDTVTGERPNLWLYIHGPTHHWAISAQREAGALLPAAETFSTIRALLDGSFKDYPAVRFEAAWEAAIYPDHGWGGKEGQITDRLFRKKFEFARDEGRDMLNLALAEIASRITMKSPLGVPIVVFNTLSWKRTDPVVCLVRPKGPEFRLIRSDGEEIHWQRLPSLPGQPAEAVRIEFLAENVPSLGYKTWYLTEGSSGGVTNPPVETGTDVIENGFYRIELAPGGLKSVYDKELAREVLDTGKFLGFEVFTMQSVGNGAGEFGRVQQPTMEGFDRLSLHSPAWRFEAAESGPLRTVVRFEQPLKNCTVREKLIVRNDIKRIDCEVDILRWDGDPYREFRIALPVGADNGRVTYEVPLGVVEVGKSEITGTGGPAYGSLVYDELCSDIRPREVQNFIGAGNDVFGMTLTTSAAVCDFKDPTPLPVPYPVLQPILLASRRSCHGEGNWYLQEGDHSYRFSMTSHRPGWRNGYQQGIQPNHPLIALVNPVSRTGASLPESMGFVSLSAANVLVSTLKKAEDDDNVVLRVYDIEGRDAEAALDLFSPVRAAEKVNIIEEEGTALRSRKTGLLLKVGHHAIETFKLVISRMTGAANADRRISPAP
jgi:alpha-mannosidase